MDAFADKEEIDVTNDEFGHEIVHRAQRAGLSPQQYYDQLLRAGTASAVFGDVRRGKALSILMERITITDSAGNPVSLDAMRGDDHERPRRRRSRGHDHD
jgi:trigger factor